jgi:hypothetical protein
MDTEVNREPLDAAEDDPTPHLEGGAAVEGTEYAAAHESDPPGGPTTETAPAGAAEGETWGGEGDPPNPA